MTVASDYAFRGVDRTNGPSAQGELDAFGEKGWYVGTWISNNRAAGGAEIDAYAGESKAFTAFGRYPVRVDGGAIGYVFTGSETLGGGQRRNTDFAEAYLGARFGPIGLKVYATPDYENAGGTALSARGNLRWPFSTSLTGILEAGINVGPGLRDFTATLAKDGVGRDYLDYAASMEFRLPQDFVITAGVAGTTLDISRGPGRGASQPRVVATLRRRFDF